MRHFFVCVSSIEDFLMWNLRIAVIIIAKVLATQHIYSHTGLHLGSHRPTWQDKMSQKHVADNLGESLLAR